MRRLNLYLTPRINARGRGLLDAMGQSANRRGIVARYVQAYREDDAALATYGLGGPDRWPIAQRHMRAGGTVLAWDAGYWLRKLPNPHRKYRLTINGFHPPQYVMRGDSPDASRWKASGMKVRQAGSVDGPVILVGNGPKSIAVGADGWALAKLREIRAVWPGRPVLYRPKPRNPAEPGVAADAIAGGDIESVLATASLVVTRHSNVAVDACRMGVPVVCDDGAAAAIYPQRLEDADRQPDANTRLEFLHRLAWWQWSQVEIADGREFWPWLEWVLREV